MKLSAEAKVGLIVILGVAILTYMSFKVGEFRLTGKTGKTIKIVFDSASGLSRDASVQVAGVEIGTVYDIQLEDGKAVVAIQVHQEVDIDRESEAYVRSFGLLGDKHVEILLGRSGVLLKEGETLTASHRSEEIGPLIGKLSSIADDLKAVSSSLKGAIGTQKGEQTIQEILENFRKMSADLSRVVDRNDDRFERVLKNIDELTGNLNQAVKTDSEDFHQTIIHARSASESIDSIFQKVDQGTGTLGQLVNNDDISRNLNKALVSADDVLGVKRKYKAFVSLRSEGLVEANDTKGYVSLKLQPRKDKFYLFELVSPEGTKGDFSESTTTKEITNTGTGAGSPFFPTDVTQTIHEEKTSDKLMYTAMFGRAFGQTAFRLGLMESTGGLGVDHTLFGKRAALHLDLWDFEGENSFGGGVHAKLRADLNFLKFFYLHAGYDNFLNTEDSSLFYGAGISFQDEDIKDLFGLLPVGK